VPQRVAISVALHAILAVTLITTFSSTAMAAPPVADANHDQILPVGSLVVLDGSLSSDADGDSLAYAWTITAAPVGSTVSLTGDTTSSPAFVADRAGSYTVLLTVTAGGETSQDAVRIQATSASLQNGLLGYWRFDETATQTVFDSSGNANDGTIVSGGRTEGRFGGALTFSGSNNSHASVPRRPNSSLFDIADQMTVSVWVYPTSLPDGFRAVVQSQIGTLVHPDQFYLGFGPRNGSIWYKWHLAANDFGSNANGDIYEGVPETNRWIHMVGTYDGTIMRLYVDGTEVGTFAVQGDIRIDDNPIVIGSEENSSEPQVVTRGFRGHVDELRIYNRALSSAEVTELYSGLGGTTSPPEVVNPGNQVATEGVYTELQIEASDDDGDSLTIDGDGFPPGLDIDADGLIAGTPTAPGLYRVSVSAFDGIDTSTIRFDWSVLPESGGPVPLLGADIGDVGATGSTFTTAGGYILEGSGRDIYRRADEFHFAYRQLSGDGEIIARVVSVQNTNAWAKAGVMIRASLDDDAINAMMAVTPGKGIEFQYRPQTGAGTQTPSPRGVTSFPLESAPAWVRLVRSGNQLSGFISSDGVNWTPVPTGPVVLDLDTDVYIGLALSSHNDGVLALAEFDAIRVTTGGSGTNTAPWLTNPGPQFGDVGEYVSLQLIGGDDDGDSVEFSATGLPPGLGVTSDGLIAGTPTTAGAYLVDAVVTDSMDSTLATFTWDIAAAASNTPPTVENPGPQVTQQDVPVTLQVAVDDEDGDPVTVTATGLPPGLEMDAAGEISGAPIAEGVFNVTVDADDGQDNTAINFSWTVTTASGGPALASLDIGDVAAAGSYLGNGQSATIQASGRDIFGRADEFHFAYRPLSGDGEIIARVVSVQTTAGWAKAGVMIRASLDDDAINAMMAVTPRKGIEFQYRPQTGAGTKTPSAAGTSIFPSESAPAWVRLVRSGNQLTGFISSDGVNWTPVPTGPVVLDLDADVYIGLAVTSHNDGVLTTAEFDAVTIR
jgi:hypothetical protein